MLLTIPMRIDERNTDPTWLRLKNMGIKLRSMAYLLENQRGDQIPIDQLYDIRWGIGLILSEYSRLAHDLAERLEHEELVVAAKKGQWPTRTNSNRKSKKK